MNSSTLRIPISWAFSLFLVLSILFFGISLSGVMVARVDDLVKGNRDALIGQQFESLRQNFGMYFYYRNTLLVDYASFPILIQGVMHPEGAGGANAKDFLNTLSFFGKEVPLHLMDLDKNILFSTKDSTLCFHSNGIKYFNWPKRNKILVSFCQRPGSEDTGWLLIAPIMYHGEIEGFIGAEFSAIEVKDSLRLDDLSVEHEVHVTAGNKILLNIGDYIEQEFKTIHIPNTDLNIKYRSSNNAVVEARKTIVSNLLVSLLIVASLIIAISQVLGRKYFVKPLEKLRSVTRSMADGDPIREDNEVRNLLEIEDLRTNFGVMVDKIHYREMDLRRANEELNKLNQRLVKQQSLLVQSEKLASVGQLAAGVAHEINNPTGFVKGNIQIMHGYIDNINSVINSYQQVEKELVKKEPENQYLSLLNEVKNSCDIDYILEDIGELTVESIDGMHRIQEIVKDLKSFSRVDDGALHEIDLNDGVIKKSIRLVATEIKYKCEIKQELQPLPLFPCKPGEISQVIMNLLINAYDAIDDVGIITIRSYFRDDMITIEVSDTGSGIPEDSRYKLFDPFYTTKEIGKGTGLGLSICQAIVNKHDGEISFETEINKGTTFFVKLPIKSIDIESEDV